MKGMRLSVYVNGIKKQLKKLNSDCNKTVGLEAKLSLAVGARVMLRRNLVIKSGLVNGAMSTVMCITLPHVTVQFDHINQPYNIEMVKRMCYNYS